MWTSCEHAIYRSTRVRKLQCKAAALPEALLFDCDGVLVDTERDGHRVTFNQAFKEKGLTCEWGVEEYGELVKIGGGKERMTKCVHKHPDPRQHTCSINSSFKLNLYL